MFYARVAQLDRALASEAKGRRFESYRGYHLKIDFRSRMRTLGFVAKKEKPTAERARDDYLSARPRNPDWSG